MRSHRSWTNGFLRFRRDPKRVLLIFGPFQEIIICLLIQSCRVLIGMKSLGEKLIALVSIMRMNRMSPSQVLLIDVFKC
jgi:hypothetical protein